MPQQHEYTTRSAAKRAMIALVNKLQRQGVHTGALIGDGGYTRQWTTNSSGKTAWATVTPKQSYYAEDRRWVVETHNVGGDNA